MNNMRLAKLKKAVRKRGGEPFWVSRLIWRHVSIYVTWVCTRLHVPAVVITFFSLASGIAGAVLLCWRRALVMIIGVALIYVWWLLDHVDGELARYEVKVLGRRPNLAGAYLDLLVHRWVLPLAHLCLGIGLMRTSRHWWYVLMGAVAGGAYVGFTRTAGVSVAFGAIAAGKLDPARDEVRELSALAGQVPAHDASKRGTRKLVEVAKSLKMVFAYPGCLLLLAVAISVDIAVPPAAFPAWGRLEGNATLAYLALTCLLSVAQHVSGTWYVAKILGRLP